MSRRKKPAMNQFSLDTFQAFEPFINIFGCGKKVYFWETGQHEPRPLITRQTRQLFTRYKAGERNLHYDYGEPFQPWHFISGIFSAKQVDEQIFEREVYYYTSNEKKFGLVYLDIDAHYPFHTDVASALALLQELFPDQALWRDSDRGMNGYVKICHHGELDLYHKALERLEDWLQAYFRSHRVLCDVEVKGGVNTKAKNASLAKLPFSTFLPYLNRDRWNYPMLRKFEALPVLSIGDLSKVIATLKANVDQGTAVAFSSHVNTLKQAAKATPLIRQAKAGIPCDNQLATAAVSRVQIDGTATGSDHRPITCDSKTTNNCEPSPVTCAGRGTTKEKHDTTTSNASTTYRFHWKLAKSQGLDTTGRNRATGPGSDGSSRCNPATRTLGATGPISVGGQDQGLGRVHSSLPSLPDDKPRSRHEAGGTGICRSSIENLRAIPDSYKRQLAAGLLFARHLRRVPTEEELLAVIKANDLFTGSWYDNLARRDARVRHILQHIAKTFGTTKCNEGRVEVEKYRTWAKQAFPVRIPLSHPHLFTMRFLKRGFINHEDIAVYLAIFDFCLKWGQLFGDKGIPHARIVALWQKLYREGKTNRSVRDVKIRAIRELLASRQIIEITDPHYSLADHRSMKYDYGKFFPGKKLYRTEAPSLCRIALDPSNPKKFRIVDNRKEEEELPNTVPTSSRSVGLVDEQFTTVESHWDTS
jgi:hypothetical protein